MVDTEAWLVRGVREKSRLLTKLVGAELRSAPVLRWLLNCVWSSVCGATLPKPLINTACPKRPVFRSLTFRDRKPPSSEHRRLAHKQHSATSPNQQSFCCCCCCCCSSSAFRISLFHLPTTSFAPRPLGDLVSAVYHCPRRPRAGHTQTLDGPSPPHRPLLRATLSPVCLAPSRARPRSYQQYVISAGRLPAINSSHSAELRQRRPRQHGRQPLRPVGSPTAFVSFIDETGHRWLCLCPPLATSRSLV